MRGSGLQDRSPAPIAAGRGGQIAVDSVQAEILVLLGLLLGFTVAMSVSRYDGRKHAVVSEANAIGTAALRARLLPVPERGEAMTLLRQYVDIRLQSAQQRLDPAALHELERKAAQLHEKLWLLAAAVNHKEPQNFTTGLFITALNDLIDAKGLRDAALDNHVPASVLVLLFATAILAVGMIGYSNGLANHRAAVVTGMLMVLFALTIFVIVDLDRPRRGLIRVSQISMTELKKGLDKPLPSALSTALIEERPASKARGHHSFQSFENSQKEVRCSGSSKSSRCGATSLIWRSELSSAAPSVRS